MKNFEEKALKSMNEIIGGESDGVKIKYTSTTMEDGTVTTKLDIYWEKKGGTKL